MTRKINIAAILTVLVALAPNAYAEIASKAYVDDRDNILIFGTTTPTESQIERLDDLGGAYGFAKEAYDKADDAFDKADEAYDKADDAYYNANRAYIYAEHGLEHSVAIGQASRNDGLVAVIDEEVKIATSGVINDALVSSGAAIQLGKLAMPTPPQICETKGCMLMYYDGKYVWETITRDNSESISTTGYVSATPSTGITISSSSIIPVEN